MAGRLGLVDEDLNTCVGCGLCLPHCPTYRVSGEEAASPRGRIAAMRDGPLGGQAINAEFVGFMDACVQCRGCETACPSGVPFGHLMEATRETLASEHRTTSRLGPLRHRAPAAPCPATPRTASPRAAPPQAHRDRRRRLLVHRLRDGRVAARHARCG